MIRTSARVPRSSPAGRGHYRESGAPTPDTREPDASGCGRTSGGVAVSERQSQLLQKCIQEAKIWRNEGRPKPNRRRARRRFDRALRALDCNPLERLQIHLVVVDVADASLRASCQT